MHGARKVKPLQKGVSSHSDMVVEVEMDDDFDTGFTLAEIMKMKNLYKGMGEKSLNLQFYQELAAKFNNSVHRCGKPLIKWEQVECWLQDLRKKELQTKASSLRQKVEKFIGPMSMMIDKSTDESSSLVKCEDFKVHLPNKALNLAVASYQKPKAVAAAELSGLVFEAKSSKDLAWYDVGSFLNYRVTSSGELEVRVRFAGYSNDHDEWVNVKRGVRERSIPLEHSECEKVKVGDLVLCFRENEDHAVYCDARVLDIQRRIHDDTEGCTCIFVVRYDYDFSEDQVQLNKICCRPTP